MNQQQVAQGFKQQFGHAPNICVRSPGRVNIIGEHTDYNEGFVFPMALECATWLALSPRDDSQIHIYSDNLHEQVTLDMAQLYKPDDDVQWQDYVAGVASYLEAQVGRSLKGFDGFVVSDVPMGAGLSSSASFELATAYAFCEINTIEWHPIAMAKLAQKAENKWVGVNCGIMDQLICAAGVEAHACLIDCRDLNVTAVPLPIDTVVVIMDTATRRGLVDSAYNERRMQCETVAKQLGVPFLRDVTLDQLESNKTKIDPTAYRRAYHIISENDRVLAAAEAMRANNPKALGQLMVDSHHSLNKYFEVTNDELNIMVNVALSAPGCFGARMTGAGFGGCAVALVAESEVDSFIQRVQNDYQQQTDLVPALYLSRAMDGCGKV